MKRNWSVGRDHRRGLKKNSAVVVIVLIVVALYQTRFWDKPTGSSREERSSSFTRSAAEGTEYDGVGGDKYLNRKKNRDTPPQKVENLTVAQIINLGHGALSLMGTRDRVNWESNAIRMADTMERRGVRVEGYIVKARESGPESCNGRIDSLRDYHLWITDDPYVDKREGLVAEITPRWRARYPEWRLRFFNKLAKQRAKVRVTGWLLWDQEHPSEVGKSKGTCWEIHPITLFEIWDNGEWRTLSGELALN